jgi:hypothetical protein
VNLSKYEYFIQIFHFLFTRSIKLYYNRIIPNRSQFYDMPIAAAGFGAVPPMLYAPGPFGKGLCGSNEIDDYSLGDGSLSSQPNVWEECRHQYEHFVDVIDQSRMAEASPSFITVNGEPVCDIDPTTPRGAVHGGGGQWHTPRLYPDPAFISWCFWDVPVTKHVPSSNPTCDH